MVIALLPPFYFFIVMLIVFNHFVLYRAMTLALTIQSIKLSLCVHTDTHMHALTNKRTHGHSRTEARMSAHKIK